MARTNPPIQEFQKEIPWWTGKVRYRFLPGWYPGEKPFLDWRLFAERCNERCKISFRRPKPSKYRRRKLLLYKGLRQVGARRLEHPSKSSEKQVVSEMGGTPNGTLVARDGTSGANTADLLRALESLSADERQAIVAAIQGRQEAGKA